MISVSVSELIAAVQEIETGIDTGQIEAELNGEEILEEDFSCNFYKKETKIMATIVNPKAEKVEKVKFPIPEGGFLKVPENFDPKNHKPLLRKAFKEDAIFFDWKADLAGLACKRYRLRAEESRKFGNIADRTKARKIMKMQDKIADLRKELEGQGIDVDSLLGN